MKKIEAKPEMKLMKRNEIKTDIEKRQPLTSRDREQYVHQYRKDQNMVVWTVKKARFGQNDILGCIDTISYDPYQIILDQTTTVHHISDRINEIEKMLLNAPESIEILIEVHGIDGYRIRKEKKWIPVVTRHVKYTWMETDEWEKEEVPVRPQEGIKNQSEDLPMTKYTSNEEHDPKTPSKMLKSIKPEKPRRR